MDIFAFGNQAPREVASHKASGTGDEAAGEVRHDQFAAAEGGMRGDIEEDTDGDTNGNTKGDAKSAKPPKFLSRAERIGIAAFKPQSKPKLSQRIPLSLAGWYTVDV